MDSGDDNLYSEFRFCFVDLSNKKLKSSASVRRDACSTLEMLTTEDIT